MSNPTPRATVTLQPNAQGASVTNYITCLVLAKDSPHAAAEIAGERVRGIPHLARALQTKAAVGAQGLSATDPYLSGEWYGALASDLEREITQLMNPAPFRVRIPAEAAAGGTAEWVGQGLPIPNYRSTTATITLDYAKLAACVAMSVELARFGRVAQAAQFRILRAAWDKGVSVKMLDPTIAATINRPASLTYGCASTTSTGTTAAQISADLAAMISKIQSPGIALRWIMRPLTFARIAAALGSVGLNVTVQSLLGIPVVLASNSPKQVTLLDCAAVAYAADGEMDIEVTSQASIEMSDAPGQTGMAGTGAQMVSCYQSGLFAAKITSGISWQHLFYSVGSPTVPAGCTYMVVTY